MLEDSVESFIVRWRGFAATVKVFPKVEGSPLIECEALGRVFYLFERTGPYATPTGEAKLIIHPVVEAFIRKPIDRPEFAALGPGRLYVRGTVIENSGSICVVNAGIPFVVGLLEPVSPPLEVGEGIEFESLAPVHGFVVTEPQPLSVAS